MFIMGNRIIKGWMILSTIVVISSGCVTSKQYKDLEARKNACDSLNTSLAKQNAELQAALTDAMTEKAVLDALNKSLKNDTLNLGIEYRDINTKYQALLAENRELEDKYVKLAKGKQDEATQLLADLRESQSKLQEREDKLKELENDLNDKARKLAELQAILDKKDQDVQNLKNKVLEALKGFNENGLTVEIRNGKVYVSLEEKLLFASGSAEVDSKGQEALKQLAKVLEKDGEINIMVEGHTDNVPLRGSGCIKDNWDLSAARSMSILRILLKSGTIDPNRITVAGRGEYAPLVANDSVENKAKNRRTEIILTPKLNELFKILESN